jgi:hypothetical protein
MKAPIWDELKLSLDGAFRFLVRLNEWWNSWR